MQKRVLLILSVMVILALSTVTLTQAFGPFGARATGPRNLTKEDLTRPLDQLNLSDKQKAEFQKLQEEQFEKNRSLREESRKLMFEMRQMTLDRNPDEKLLQKKLDRFNEIRQLMYEQRNGVWEKMQSLLTEEQKKELDSLRGNRRRGWGHGRGCGFGNGPGGWR